MSGIGRIAITPVNLNTIPRPAEGSNSVAINQNWADPALGGGTLATYNLLQQYQSGQFTNIQAVWIDNGTNLKPVVFTSVETGQMIRVPGLAVGMYPLVSGVAPIFTLQIQTSGGQPGAATTRLILFNTPQRYFVQSAPPVGGFAARVFAGFAGAGLPAQVLTGQGITSQYLQVLGFQLSLVMTAGAWLADQVVTISLVFNGTALWEDNFNVFTTSFGAIYSKQVTLLVPSTPLLTTDSYTLVISAIQPGGTIVFDLILWYQLLTIA